MPVTPSGRCFVSASAGFASPLTVNNRKSPRRRHSWTQSCPAARCPTRQMPALLQMPTAAAESGCMLSVMLRPRSRQTLWIASCGRAQRHRLLRRAPVLDEVQAPHCFALDAYLAFFTMSSGRWSRKHWVKETALL